MNKLVRDKIPEIIKNSGRVPHIKQISGSEYEQMLVDKLTEEGKEFLSATDEDKVNELADLYEIVLSLGAIYNLSLGDISCAAEKKRQERGGFNNGYFYMGDKEA